LAAFQHSLLRENGNSNLEIEGFSIENANYMSTKLESIRWVLLGLQLVGLCEIARAQSSLVTSELATFIDVTQVDLSKVSFIAPNEARPTDILLGSHIHRLPEGLLFTVGSERALIDLSLMPNLTGAIIVDRDPIVIAYMYLNLGLLMISATREDYLHLRLASSHKEWLDRINSTSTRVPFLNFLGNPVLYKWWADSVRTPREDSTFHLFHRPPSHSRDFFAGANYLFSDDLFDRVKRLTDGGMILPLHGDLLSSEFLAGLARKLGKLRMSVSLVDASNLADPPYLQGGGVYHVIEQLYPVMNQHGVLLTVVHEIHRDPSHGPSDWQYLTWPFRDLRDPRGRELFLNGFMPQEVSFGPIGTAMLVPWIQIESAHSRFLTYDQSWAQRIMNKCSRMLSKIEHRLSPPAGAK
jgi:hypothetical protein